MSTKKTEKPGLEGPEQKSNPDTSLLEEFASDTTAHGCKHIASHSRGIVARSVVD
jgi:hypothetical protein